MKTINRKGFSLPELFAALFAGCIVVLGLGMMLTGSYGGWIRMYNRVHSDTVTDGYVNKRAFDAIIRRSSLGEHPDTGKRPELKLNSGTGIADELIVYFYSDPNEKKVPRVDQFARFYKNNSTGHLDVDYGSYDKAADKYSDSVTQRLASNVKDVRFYVVGANVGMLLKLDNGRQRMTVACSAKRHSE